MNGRQQSTPRVLTPQEVLGPLNPVELRYAPRRLHVRGPLTLPLSSPRVAVIGTRAPTEAGRDLGGRLSAFLSHHGVTVVSGLARGIDTIAHRTAIDTDGATIAVVGTPLSRAYPPENAALQDEIAQSFLVVSQFDEGHATQPKDFILRNRTMALVADASVIVESGEGGGSLSQGWEALRLGRPLFIHHREFQKSGLHWPKEMVRYGAVEFRELEELLESIPNASTGGALPALGPA